MQPNITKEGNNILAESESKEDDGPGGENFPPEILSLGRLMRKFDVWRIAMLLHHIDHALEVIKPMAESDSIRDDKLDAEDISAWISGNILTTQMIALEIGLDSTHKRVWDGGGPFWMKARVGITWQEANSELRVLRQCIEADLEDKWFAFILPEKAKMLKRAKDEWHKVLDSIPNAKEDIQEALYCYALERNTASVFHLMRVAEHGLRILAKKMRISNGFETQGTHYSNRPCGVAKGNNRHQEQVRHDQGVTFRPNTNGEIRKTF